MRIQLNGEGSPSDLMPASVRTADELPSAPTTYLLQEHIRRVDEISVWKQTF